MLTAIALFLLSQNQPCTNVRPCVTQSLTYSRPYSQFETCTRSIYTRTIVDADAGVIRMCQLDGGWEAVGSSGGGSSSSYWYDGGVGYITATEKVSLTGFTANGNENPNGSFIIRNTNSAGGAFQFTDSNYNVISEIFSPLYLGVTGYQGLSLRTRGGGDSPITFTNSSYGIYAGFGGSNNSYGLWINSPSTRNGISFMFDGARIDLGTGSTDYIASDGANTVVAGGVRLGGTSASVITSSYECDWATDGGNGINAGTQREYIIGCTGVKPNAECVMSVPGGGTFQTQGVSVDCYAPDNNQIGVRTYNWTSGTDGLSPKQGTYKIRVFNNQ